MNVLSEDKTKNEILGDLQEIGGSDCINVFGVFSNTKAIGPIMVSDLQSNFNVHVVTYSENGKAQIGDISKFDIAMCELRVAEFFSDLEVAKGLLIERPFLPVLAISRNDNTEVKMLAFNAGIADFQLENVALEEIIVRIRALAKLGKATRMVEIQNEELLRSMSEIKSLEKDRIQTQATLIHTSKMASLGEVAGNLAHEINNPLGILNGRILQLRKILGAEKFEKSEAIDLIDKLTLVSKRIASITKGLKSFSRMGEADPFEQIRVQELVEDTLAFCAENIRQMGIEFRLTAIDSSLLVSGRPTQVSQVLLNLLSNARDAVEGYIEKWISLSVESTAKDIFIKVIDSGTGLPQHLIDRIYEPFFTTKPVNKGTGLGLSISRKILQEHGGDLMVDRNCPNTCFVMQLPKSGY